MDYQLFCEKMHCHMSYAACVKRQAALAKQMNRRHGYSGGHRITTDECRDCAKGKEAIKIMEAQENYNTKTAAVTSERNNYVYKKVCNRTDCEHKGDLQPLENFDRSKQQKDGRVSYCKDCRRKTQRERSARRQDAPKNKTHDPRPKSPDLPSLKAKERLKQKLVGFLAAGQSLAEAYNIINGDRQDSYGHPEDSFTLIAEFWTAYLRQAVTKNKGGYINILAIDVAHMMALFKIARMLGQAPCRDNYIDAQGYLAIAADRLLKHDGD